MTRHCYGFLPGYRPPEVSERERAATITGCAAHSIAARPGRASIVGAGTASAPVDADPDRSDVELRPLIDAGSRR